MVDVLVGLKSTRRTYYLAVTAQVLRIFSLRTQSHDENDQRTGRLAEKCGFEFVGGT